MRFARLVAILPLCLLCLGAGDDDPEYPRIDPNIRGGERYGADEDDDYSGYPADPGDPDDAYHDVSSEYQRYSPNWTGAFIGGGAVAGMGALRGDYLDDVDRTIAYGAFFNWSSVSQIVDLQLHYLRADFSPTLDDGTEVDLLRQSAGGAILLHPLFLNTIGATRWGWTLANTYLLTGVGIELNTVEAPDERNHYDSVGWRIGAGTGTFLDNPNDGGAFWLGLQFQRTYVQGAPSNPDVGRRKLRENLLLLRLSYRWNGAVFAGFRGPRGRSQDASFGSP